METVELMNRADPFIHESIQEKILNSTSLQHFEKQLSFEQSDFGILRNRRVRALDKLYLFVNTNKKATLGNHF